jgi:predicted O-methyltransferase YrrM
VNSDEASAAVDPAWGNDETFDIAGVEFRASLVNLFESSSTRFLLVKPRHMIERYREVLASLQPKRILELGIYQGGSAAFFALMCQPQRLVAVDIKVDPTVGLERFIDERGLRDRLSTHYSFDQADVSRLHGLVAAEFGGEPIDLVVDDASHRLGPTRSSFNALFPHLRPGGVYVIEDWSGQHQLDARLQVRAERDAAMATKLAEHAVLGTAETPLSVLLFELVLASAYAPDIFAEIVIANGWAHVVRGDRDLDPSAFDVSRIYSDWAGSLIGRTRPDPAASDKRRSAAVTSPGGETRRG